MNDYNGLLWENFKLCDYEMFRHRKYQSMECQKKINDLTITLLSGLVESPQCGLLVRPKKNFIWTIFRGSIFMD